MKYVLRLALFSFVLMLPAVALAQGLELLPFNPEDVGGVFQMLLEKMLSRDWIGLGALAVIVATHFGGKLLAPRIAFFGTGHGKVALALITSTLFGVGTLLLSTPLASITPSLVLQVLGTALGTAIFGAGTVRMTQAGAAALARRAGQDAVDTALGANPTGTQVAAVLQGSATPAELAEYYSLLASGLGDDEARGTVWGVEK